MQYQPHAEFGFLLQRASLIRARRNQATSARRSFRQHRVGKIEKILLGSHSEKLQPA